MSISKQFRKTCAGLVAVAGLVSLPGLVQAEGIELEEGIDIVGLAVAGSRLSGLR